MTTDLTHRLAIYPMVEEADAVGVVAAVYGRILSRMPLVPSLFKSFAVCPAYLVLEWRQADAVFDREDFGDGSERLRASVAREMTPPQDGEVRDNVGCDSVFVRAGAALPRVDDVVVMAAGGPYDELKVVLANRVAVGASASIRFVHVVGPARRTGSWPPSVCSTPASATSPLCRPRASWSEPTTRSVDFVSSPMPLTSS